MPRNECKMAFGTRYRYFKYTIMPFGLTNAPVMFQHFMDDIFQDLFDQFAVIYLDDILIYSPSQESHLCLVLQQLQENRLYAKLEKCQFFQSTIKFLGHCISPTGIAMELSKVRSLCGWQPPWQVKDVQRLLGFANYYPCLHFPAPAPHSALSEKGSVPGLEAGIHEGAYLETS